MADAQYDFLIRLGFSEGGAVNQAIAAEERIRAVFQRLNEETAHVGGPLDTKSIQRYADELKAALRNAFNVDLSNSEVFKALSKSQSGANVRGTAITRQGITDTRPIGDVSQYLEKQVRLFLANLNKAEVDAKSKLKTTEEDPEEKRGYATINARTKAQAEALLRVTLANNQLVRAIQKAADEQEKVANREATEAQKRLDEINKAHYKRIQSEDAAARAAEAEAKAAVERAAEHARQQQAARAIQSQVSYPGATPDTQLGRVQRGVNEAESKLETAEMARARIYDDENKTAEQMVAADRMLSSATTALAVAREKVAIEEERIAGVQRANTTPRQVSYPNAAPGSREYAVNKAENRLETANAELANIRTDSTATEKKIRSAEDRVISATDSLANARVALRNEQDRAARAQAADNAAPTRQSYPNAAAGSREAAVNKAERDLEVATLALARVRANEGRDEEKIKAAQSRYQAATENLTKAQQNLKDEQDAAAKASQARVAAQNFQVSYPGAALVPGTLGRSQVMVNNAERALEVATNLRAELLAKGNPTYAQLLVADGRLDSATTALATARANLARVESTQGGLLGQFHTGFRGQSDRPYAEQIGQALKFSLFYGTAYKMMFAFTQTLQQTLQEGIAFQQAMTELRLSAGDANKNIDALGDRLGRASVEAGFAPSQGVLVGARSLGLYGVTDAPAATQDSVAEISARVVSRLALSSGQQPADLQTNIAAIVQAFGGNAQAQYRVADLDAYMAHKFGVAPGSTIQAVSEAGTVGRAAGFNQEEVSAIAADIMSRTGQTAPAVAGFMAQIFSRGGEGSLTNVATKYGVDPTLELSDQIKQLAEVYKSASPQDRAEMSAAFGRGKVQNAAIALLQDYGAVQDAATKARGGAADGAADKSFAERMGNIGGQIAETTGALKEFANLLGQSGLLDLVGMGVVVFRDLVQAGSGVLRMWNSINRELRDAVLAIALFGGALKVAGGSELAAGVLGRVGISRAIGPFGGRMMATTAEGALVPLASRAGMGAAAGGAAAMLLNPVTIAIGGLLALGALKNTSDKLRDAQDFATKTLTQGIPGVGATTDDYRNRASALREAAQGQRDATTGWWSGSVAKLTGAYTTQRESAARLDTQAFADDAIANALDRMDAQRAATADPSLITGFDSQSLSDSMTQITNAGGTAADRMRALSQAIRGAGNSAAASRNAFDPGRFALESQEGITAALTGALSGIKSDRQFAGVDGLFSTHSKDFYGTKVVDTTDNWIRDTFDPASVIRSVRERLGNTNLAKASGQDLSNIASGILDDSGLNLTGDDLTKAHDALVKFLKDQRTHLRDLMDGAKDLTGPEVTAIVNQFVADAQERAGNLQDSDLAGKVANARRLVRDILTTIAKSEDGKGSHAAQVQLDLARRALAQSQFDELEAMRKAAQQNANSRAEVARIGQGFLQREIRAAVRGGNSDVLAAIIAQAGKGALNLARQSILDAQKVAVAADQARAQYATMLAGIAHLPFAKGDFTHKDPGGYQKMLDALDNALTAGTKEGNVYATGSDVPGYDSSSADKETRAEREAARAAADAVKSGSTVAAARADIASARASIAKADKNSVAYWQAMGQLYQGQQALADAILERWKNQELLSIDMTNPLAMARVDAEAARRKLRQDRRAGKSQEVLDADRIVVRNAEANREATAFQQRLDAVQTADQLGRISHQKYLRYLNSEHDRLESIKHRTFQQQQELDQIDGLLKDAANAMDAQWNFGDIKLPTPYQMRRYVEDHMKEVQRRGEAQYGGKRAQAQGDLVDAASQLGGSVHAVTNQTTIQINGADVAKVRRVVEDVLGRGHRTRTAQPRRR